MAVAFLAGLVCLPAVRVLAGVGGQTSAGVEAGGEAAAQGEEMGVGIGTGTIDWESAPRVDLVCRTYEGSLHIMWNTFMPSYLVSTVW